MENNHLMLRNDKKWSKNSDRSQNAPVLIWLLECKPDMCELLRWWLFICEINGWLLKIYEATIKIKLLCIRNFSKLTLIC